MIDPEAWRAALEKAAADTEPLLQRLAALAAGHESVAKMLHQTADGLLVIHDADREETSASLHTVAAGLESIAREVSGIEAAFRELIAQGVPEPGDGL